MDAVIIRLVDMPVTMPGCTVKDANGDYNVYINARLNEEQRVSAYWHEMDHIRRGHFYQERTVAEMEEEVEEEASRCYSSRKKKSL